MRTLYVIVVIALFVAYCFLATGRQNRFAVPQCRIETVDVVSGTTPEHFLSEIYSAKRYVHLSDLERKHLHPVEPLTIGTRTLTTDDALTARDFLELAQAGTYKLTVRNPEAVLAFAGRGFSLREDLVAPDGTVLGKAGAHVSKKMMEDASDHAVTEVSVLGKGSVVSINGTMAMVLLIFTAMVMVLKGLLWNPLCALLDARETELKEGQVFLRGNRDTARRLEKERQAVHAEVRRAGHAVVAAARREGMIEAEKIMAASREEAYRLRTHAEAELRQAVDEAEKVVRADIPAIAGTIRTTLFGK